MKRAWWVPPWWRDTFNPQPVALRKGPIVFLGDGTGRRERKRQRKHSALMIKRALRRAA